MQACVLIPIYDHGATIGAVVESVAPLNVPCLIVDDGSHAPTRAAVEALARALPWVEVLRTERNRGKGHALKVGFRHAAARGFSHVLHLDADGQHDGRDGRALLAQMRRTPEALVLGRPVFDDSVPRSRLWARQISRVLVWAASCSFAISDPLCGFRGVPLTPTLGILDRVATGDHMEFEPEIAVRLLWDGVPVANVPTSIVYLPRGISHFSVPREYPRLAWLYARLLAGMLPRLPVLLRRPAAVPAGATVGGNVTPAASADRPRRRA